MQFFNAVTDLWSFAQFNPELHFTETSQITGRKTEQTLLSVEEICHKLYWSYTSFNHKTLFRRTPFSGFSFQLLVCLQLDKVIRFFVDLHLSEQLPLLQLVLVLLLQRRSSLHQQQLLPHLVLNALHLRHEHTSWMSWTHRGNTVGGVSVHLWRSWAPPRGTCPPGSTCWTWPCWSRSSRRTVSARDQHLRVSTSSFKLKHFQEHVKN